MSQVLILSKKHVSSCADPNCTVEHSRSILPRVLRRWWDSSPSELRGTRETSGRALSLMKANGRGILQSYSILNYILHHRQLQKKLASTAEQEFSSPIYALLVAVVFFHAYLRPPSWSILSGSGKSIPMERFDKLYVLFRSEDMILWVRKSY